MVLSLSGRMGGDEVGHIHRIIEQGDEIAILLPLSFLLDEVADQREDGREALPPEEDHRAAERERRVVILREIHEHLLERPRAPGREHHTSERDGEQAILADAVGEVLGDVRAEQVAWLVTIEPGRDRQ